MKSVCLFAAYYPGDALPYYIQVYLAELKRHFTEVILLPGDKQLKGADAVFADESQLAVIPTETGGFDFGLWYRALQQIDVSGIDKLVLVNDSCILFRRLDQFVQWSQNDGADLQGITFSEAVAPHVQSYFLVLNKPAIPFALRYFQEHKTYAHISDVIKHYEIGLSVYLAGKGLKLSAFMDNDGYTGEFSPYYRCVDHHLRKGIPLIKKKILFASYRADELPNLARMGFDISVAHYISRIKEYNKELIIDLDRLLRENRPELSALQSAAYYVRRLAIKLARPIYRRLKDA